MNVDGKYWTVNYDNNTIRFRDYNYEVDFDRDGFFDWYLHLSGKTWFTGPVWFEFIEMCEEYAPLDWMNDLKLYNNPGWLSVYGFDTDDTNFSRFDEMESFMEQLMIRKANMR